MMAVDIKAVRNKAQCAMGGRLNIIERTALWYRLERIGEELPSEPTLKGSVEKLQSLLDEEWIGKQWDIVNQLRGQVLHLSSKVTEMRASAKAKRKPEKHKLILINRGGGRGGDIHKDIA